MKKHKERENKIGTLQVSGRGEIRVAPDIARVRLAVVTEGESAQEAASKNAEIAGTVVGAMRDLDISKKDIQTTGLRISPVYRYEENREPVIAGYRAENAVSVTAPIKLAGKVFDAGVASGANQSSGISFGLRDERPYREQALKAAVKAAQEDACIVGEAMDVDLSTPSEIHVDEGAPVAALPEARMEKSLAATPVLPGQLTISAHVRVVYRYS